MNKTATQPTGVPATNQSPLPIANRQQAVYHDLATRGKDVVVECGGI